MSEPLIIDPAESSPITFDFSDGITSGVTLVSVVFSGAGLTLGAQSNDYPNARSTMVISGAHYGVRYSLEATGTFSNGTVANRAASILGWQK